MYIVQSTYYDLGSTYLHYYDHLVLLIPSRQAPPFPVNGSLCPIGQEGFCKGIFDQGIVPPKLLSVTFGKCMHHLIGDPTSAIRLDKKWANACHPWTHMAKRPSTSAIVFVIAGPWHLTHGDTLCFVTDIIRAMLLSSIWSKSKSFQIFCFFLHLPKV